MGVFDFGESGDSLKTPFQTLADYTVIIPTVGRPILRECFEALINGRVLPARVIVIDQGDNRDVAEWLRIFDGSGISASHIRSTGRSPSSARNEGMRLVQTPFVAAIDDDCLAEAGWLEAMALHLREDPWQIVTGRVEAAGDGIPQTVITSTEPYLIHHLPIQNLSPLATGNMGVSLEAAKRIGEFDENLFTAEDTDWAYRGLKMGIPVHYTPDVVVYHHHWRDRSQSSGNYKEYAKGLGVFYGKHLRLGDLSMIPRVLLALFRGVKILFQGWRTSDNDLYQKGYARLTRLVPSLVRGLMGSPPPKRRG
jgi:GT2 family glycosyltransferase